MKNLSLLGRLKLWSLFRETELLVFLVLEGRTGFEDTLSSGEANIGCGCFGSLA